MDRFVSYSELRHNLKANLDEVCNSRVPLMVERRNGDSVVILSRDDYNALEETAYLLRAPANVKRLLEALTRTSDERFSFASMEALEDALGI